MAQRLHSKKINIIKDYRIYLNVTWNNIIEWNTYKIIDYLHFNIWFQHNINNQGENKHLGTNEF